MNGAWSAGRSWGLALFMRQGLAAWMHAWPRQVGDDPPQPKPTSPGVSSAALPASVSGQLVTVLANMVLAAKQEIFT